MIHRHCTRWIRIWTAKAWSPCSLIAWLSDQLSCLFALFAWSSKWKASVYLFPGAARLLPQTKHVGKERALHGYVGGRIERRASAPEARVIIPSTAVTSDVPGSLYLASVHVRRPFYGPFPKPVLHKTVIMLYTQTVLTFPAKVE